MRSQRLRRSSDRGSCLSEKLLTVLRVLSWVSMVLWLVRFRIKPYFCFSDRTRRILIAILSESYSFILQHRVYFSFFFGKVEKFILRTLLNTIRSQEHCVVDLRLVLIANHLPNVHLSLFSSILCFSDLVSSSATRMGAQIISTLDL